MKKVFYMYGKKHHIISTIEDCGNIIVVHKHWSKNKQAWRYGVCSQSLILMLQKDSKK